MGIIVVNKTRMCGRCRSPWNGTRTCTECGAGATKPTRQRPCRSKPGGKRGRNSGKVSQHGKKK